MLQPTDGATVGLAVGSAVGSAVGLDVGSAVGLGVGSKVVGANVVGANVVGANVVGATVSLLRHPQSMAPEQSMSKLVRLQNSGGSSPLISVPLKVNSFNSGRNTNSVGSVPVRPGFRSTQRRSRPLTPLEVVIPSSCKFRPVGIELSPVI